MNVDSVTSKYFNKNSRDESLSDFQEAKQTCKGPKTIQKSNRCKPKRTTKHINVRNDIRIALRGKKNELISYSKEFDKVCKLAGVDVDSEQLQLAVALSNSLQTKPESTERSEPLTTQERVGKIRTTLQEYGFKVPDIKVPKKNTKKLKRHYKLFLTTEEERRQVVSEKYSEILFNNLESNLHDNTNSNLGAPLFNISTNTSYKSMRDNSIFYINNLVEKSPRIGSMLRDWSSIPGRPISPKLFDTNTMDFSEVDCSQNELDVILSSSIKSAQSIVNSKGIRKDKLTSDVAKVVLDDDEASAVMYNDNNDVPINLPIIGVVDEKPVQMKESHNVYCRSVSPDLFDDEVSSIMDDTKTTNILSQEEKTKVFTDDVMELTKCANSLSQNSNKPSENTTKRKSNDFMEITECIATTSEPILEKHDKIDLTQSPEKKETSIDTNRQCSQEISHKENVPNGIDLECMDLTQPSNNIDLTDNSKKDLDIESDKHPVPNIDLTQSYNDEDRNATELKINGMPISKLDSMDLTQSSTSSDDLPLVQISSKLEDTIILDVNEYLDNGKVRCSVVPYVKETLDLTQEVNNESVKELHSAADLAPSKSYNQSFFEEFVYDHSDGVENDVDEYCNEKNNSDLNYVASDVDLTQDSDSSVKNTNIDSNSAALQTLAGCFDNDNDISTDYDEVYNNTSKNNSIIACNNDVTEIQDNDDNYNSNNDVNSSQNTEFEISDKELDYSLHKSRFDVPNNFELGGISILDNVTNVNHVTLKEVAIMYNRNDSVLPQVNVKNNSIYNLSPVERNSLVPTSLVTPNSGDYIVKTDDVTPIVDYSAMTTPQRNRELDKCGLKPFKRKRAIQLLTHLYNQTHPIIERFSPEDQPTPSKKQRKELTSPEKIITSPNKSIESREEASYKKNIDIGIGEVDVCAYEVTSEVPAVKSINCDPEEWVFQKPDKAKVHSCRLPLHIAFHNYVSSRRELREAILKYEPINIDVIHKELVGYGHRYDPKDLLKFLDKKCITVKTSDNNSRNNQK